MTPTEAVDLLRSHSRASVCTLEARDCRELAEAK